MRTFECMSTGIDSCCNIFCGLNPCRLAMAGEAACIEVAQEMKKELHSGVLQTEKVSPRWMRRGFNLPTSLWIRSTASSQTFEGEENKTVDFSLSPHIFVLFHTNGFRIFILGLCSYNDIIETKAQQNTLFR